jgi:C1A family cysteine protease
MPNPYTPLSEIEFPNEWKKNLRKLNITDMEALAAQINCDSSIHDRLLNYLNITTEAEINLFDSAVTPYIKEDTEQETFMNTIQASGLIFEPDESEPQNLHYLQNLNLPSECSVFELIDEVAVRDQGSQGACTAFSGVTQTAIDRAISKNCEPSIYSPQFLYRKCKEIDGTGKQGTSLKSMCQAMQDHGVCLEFEWPYKHVKCIPEGGDAPSPLASSSAKQRKSQYYSMGPTGPDFVLFAKAMIAGALTDRPKGVCFGIELHTTFLNSYTRETGKVLIPPPGSNSKSAHAMVAVAYSDDNSPGGGYFTVINSWGEHWGDDGKAYIPYEYFIQFVQSAAVLLGEEQPWWESRESDLEHIATLSQAEVVTLGIGHASKEAFPWGTERLANQHCLIVGGSGEGKTVITKNLITQLRKSSTVTSTHILDHHNEYSDILGNDEVQNLIDVSHTGLPFRLLDNLRGLPLDLFINNVLGDIKYSNPQLGNLQIDRVKEILEKGCVESWTNTRLRKELDNGDDAKLRAQLAPVMLLLRRDDGALDCFQKPGVYVHNLGAFQNSTSRAAYAILFLSKLMDSRANGSTQEHCKVVMEEAQLLATAKSKSILERVFQESRKLNIGALYLTQQWKNVPDFVKRNTATHILFRTAAQDNGINNPQSLPAKHEALIFQGEESEKVKLLPPLETPHKTTTKPRMKPVRNTYSFIEEKGLRKIHSKNAEKKPKQSIDINNWFVEVAFVTLLLVAIIFYP